MPLHRVGDGHPVWMMIARGNGLTMNEAGIV
jgi:hypothetical protein